MNVEAALIIMLSFGVLLLDLIGLVIKLIELVNKQKDRQ
ncbi:putative holin-like toxin [Lacticaseibacillus manihotivorans]|nr:putative holin-like toxin [Lacticaseibacillus manihotivorans]